jgi:glucokinase
VSAQAGEIVSVDIGGTHARFAIAIKKPDGTIALDDPITLRTQDHVSFQSAWETYRAHKGRALPEAVSMAIAGQTSNEVIRFTNNPWVIARTLMKEKLGVSRCTIVNDFEAVAHGVALAPDDQFVHLTGPAGPLPSVGRLTVMGPGTGLGVAHLYRAADGRYRVSATEGGHIDFAPLDQIEDALLARLRKRHTRVSVERVVAGPAIGEIYHTLAALEHKSFPELDDVEIWTRGMSGEDSLAAAAVDRFCLSLGSVAGDMALAHGSIGVVIAGGLGLRLKDILLRSGFAARFCAKGRFASLMAGIPVKLITHPQPGLFGAAAAHFQSHGGTQ